MKSVHVPFGFFPDAVGGTEVYVAALATALQQSGHPVTIAAPGPAEAAYVHQHIPVRRFAGVTPPVTPRELYGEGDRTAAAGFGRILDDVQPDVVHMHAFTHACSVLLVREAHARDLPVVFTYHTPTVSCARGTLLEWGVTPCDGALSIRRCAACALHGHGVPRWAAPLLARMPAPVSRLGSAMHSRVGTALSFANLIDHQNESIHQLFAEADRVIAFRQWIADLLMVNGVAKERIVRSRHALADNGAGDTRSARSPGPLRIAFFGRMDPTKGVQVVIDAIRQLPGAALELHVYGTMQGEAGQSERARLEALARGDARISFFPSVAHDCVVPTIAAHDLLVVPSQWMETGPLVVLEAFAAGTPALGSALGGIAELIQDEVNGRLVKHYQSSEAWAQALGRIVDDPSCLGRLAEGITAPPTMNEIASEMSAVYAELVQMRRAPLSSTRCS